MLPAPGVPLSPALMASTDVSIQHNLKNPELEKTRSFLIFQPVLALSCPDSPQTLLFPPRTPCSCTRSHEQGTVCGRGTWRSAHFARAPKMVTSHIVHPNSLHSSCYLHYQRVTITFLVQAHHSHRVPGSFRAFLLHRQGGTVARRWGC